VKHPPVRPCNGLFKRLDSCAQLRGAAQPRPALVTWSLALALNCMALAGAPAVAQQAAAADNGKLETVATTASKCFQQLQTSPIAVSVY
jgi:hypothetical protein